MKMTEFRTLGTITKDNYRYDLFIRYLISLRVVEKVKLILIKNHVPIQRQKKSANFVAQRK